MPLVVMQIVEGVRVLKKWYGKNVSDTLNMADLFSEFSRGEPNDGSVIPNRLLGCKVVPLISSDRSKDAIQVSPETLVSEALSIGMYMTFSVTDMTSQSDNDTLHANGESVFMRLMTTAKKAKERKLPEFLGEESGNSKNKLYNWVINWIKKNNLTFSAGCVDTLGKELVTTLTNTFWCGYFILWKTILIIVDISTLLQKVL